MTPSVAEKGEMIVLKARNCFQTSTLSVAVIPYLTLHQSFWSTDIVCLDAERQLQKNEYASQKSKNHTLCTSRVQQVVRWKASSSSTFPQWIFRKPRRTRKSSHTAGRRKCIEVTTPQTVTYETYSRCQKNGYQKRVKKIRWRRMMRKQVQDAVIF